ncbi:MAG: hypothetical protein ACI3YK_02550 [Eubacteriales bacterium]
MKETKLTYEEPVIEIEELNSDDVVLVSVEYIPWSETNTAKW